MTMASAPAGLVRRLLVLCLGLYLATAAIVIAAEALFLSDQLQSEAERQCDTLAATFALPFGSALWDLDDNQLRILLETVASNPVIGRVEIVEQDGSVLQQSTPVALGPPRSYPLTHTRLGRQETLGTLVLEPSLNLIQTRVATSLGMAVLPTAILVFLLSAITVIVVRRQVGTPLERLADQISSLDPNRGDDRFLVQDTKSGSELSLVADAFNNLLRQFRRTIGNLQSQRAQLRTLLDTLPDLVWFKDLDGVYLACNRRFESFFGAREDAIRGKTDFDFVGKEQAALFRVNDLRAIETGKPTKNEEEIEFAEDGHREYLETVKTPVYGAEGQVIGVLGIGRDITERRRVELEMSRLLQELKQSHKLESLGSLAGGLAHEMNNVLAVVLGIASVQLKTLGPDTKLHKAFLNISRAGERGGKLVKSLLSFARRSPVKEQEIQLNSLIREEQSLLDRVTASRVGLHLDLAPDLALVKGDPDALLSAVINLCGNAVDSMTDGGTLTVRTRNRGGAQVELVIEDTGTGMSPQVLEKALEPFFTTKAVGKGTGLGLPFVDSTVRSHGGTMEIRSEVGRGTSVLLLFPVSGSAGPSSPAMTDQIPLGSSRQLRVLIVDDDSLVLESTEAVVSSLGHFCSTALSGEAALALVESGLNPDLVILDKNMPGLGGKNTLAGLRRLNAAVPVLLASGQIDQSALQLAETDPLVTLIEKPFTLDELRAQISAAVSNSPLDPELQGSPDGHR